MERAEEIEKIKQPVELVEKIIRLGAARSASDIHIEPKEGATVIRLRVDGILNEILRLPRPVHQALISRLKILAGLRTDIRYNSQDGRFRVDEKFGISFAGCFDIRLSLVPTYFGEKAVLRLLARAKETKEGRVLKSLGFGIREEAQIKKALESAHGMILVVGPTGSGKTTTLYSMLEMLLDKSISIVTLEDPIEYVIEKATQIPVHARGTFTFSHALRAVVRQDPDVIMVGEIRDSETARLAVQSALTGHLLLSTLHTTDAAATLPRLTDMGIEPYLLASTIRLIVAERLVRKICPSCKAARRILPSEREIIASGLARCGQTAEPGRLETIFEGKGCDACAGSGYLGRTSINELLMASDEVKKLIEEKTSAQEIARFMEKKGVTRLFEDGLQKVCAGITTLSEVLRVISD